MTMAKGKLSKFIRCLSLIVCTYAGSETLRATVDDSVPLWRASTTGGYAAGIWKIATAIPHANDAGVPLVMLVPTIREGHSSALMIVDPNSCTITP